MECIILAGGLGTRLRSAIGELPKCMAAVNEQPFLYYLLEYLTRQGMKRVIFSLGYKSEAVLSWLNSNSFPFDIDYVEEKEPLGTGGGIRLALKKTRNRYTYVFNGDTLFLADLKAMQRNFETLNAEALVALKQMSCFERYGSVITGPSGIILSFEEKAYRDIGDINGGIYLLDRTAFLERDFPDKFSFEKDYLEQYVGEGRFYGHRFDSYFIDIGVPEDYRKAQSDFKELFS